jgi:hypothetical protein
VLITVPGYPEKYKCVQPADMTNTLLKDYKPDVETCTPWNPLFTIIISISASEMIKRIPWRACFHIWFVIF